MNTNNYEDFASFASRWFSTLMTISGYLKFISSRVNCTYIVSHKNTQYQELYV